MLVYYDVNSTIAGFDPVKEIKWLGKGRICQFHLKDNRTTWVMAKIDFPAVMQASPKLSLQKCANLETDAPSKSVEADLTRNLQFVRKHDLIQTTTSRRCQVFSVLRRRRPRCFFEVLSECSKRPSGRFSEFSC